MTSEEDEVGCRYALDEGNGRGNNADSGECTAELCFVLLLLSRSRSSPWSEWKSRKSPSLHWYSVLPFLPQLNSNGLGHLVPYPLPHLVAPLVSYRYCALLWHPVNARYHLLLRSTRDQLYDMELVCVFMPGSRRPELVRSIFLERSHQRRHLASLHVLRKVPDPLPNRRGLGCCQSLTQQSSRPRAVHPLPFLPTTPDPTRTIARARCPGLSRSRTFSSTFSTRSAAVTCARPSRKHHQPTLVRVENICSLHSFESKASAAYTRPSRKHLQTTLVRVESI
jgi:hypothetical protein